MYACLTALIYKIWAKRNKVVWEGRCEQPEISVKGMLEEINNRVIGCLPKRISSSDRTWLANLSFLRLPILN